MNQTITNKGLIKNLVENASDKTFAVQHNLDKAKFSIGYSCFIFLHVLHRLLARKCWVGRNWKPWLPVGLLGTGPTTIWCNDPMAFCASWQSSLNVHTSLYRGCGLADSVFFLFLFYPQEQWPILLLGLLSTLKGVVCCHPKSHQEVYYIRTIAPSSYNAT